MLGDGSLSLKDYNPNLTNRLKISLNSKEDHDYLKYIQNLIVDIFKEKPIIKYRKKENTADLFIFKKEIINYLIKNVGIKLTPKWKVALIPKKFLSENLSRYVLKGYFDTDGSLVTTNNNGLIYPRLEMKICPSPMQSQFIGILTKNKFRFGTYKIEKGKVRIQLNGKNQLKKWINLIGFSNPKHSNKISRFLK